LNKDSDGLGKVILPTGTGKTLVEIRAVIDEIKSLKKNSIKSPIVKINSSRIILCFQLADEFIKELTLAGIEARYVNFNLLKKSSAFRQG
jgi:superfamily II DNA or RNA helicase